jgi:hypothetical protein
MFDVSDGSWRERIYGHGPRLRYSSFRDPHQLGVTELVFLKRSLPEEGRIFGQQSLTLERLDFALDIALAITDQYREAAVTPNGALRLAFYN